MTSERQFSLLPECRDESRSPLHGLEPVAGELANFANGGKAQVGDKTLIDTLEPFAFAFDEAVASGKSFEDSWSVAAEVAMNAALATKDLLPKIGRARPHAHKSVGTPDPGALSMAMIIGAIEKVWK